MEFIATVNKSGVIIIDKDIRKAYQINEKDQVILELIKVVRKPMIEESTIVLKWIIQIRLLIINICYIIFY